MPWSTRDMEAIWHVYASSSHKTWILPKLISKYDLGLIVHVQMEQWDLGWLINICFNTWKLGAKGHEVCPVEDSHLGSLTLSWIPGGELFAPYCNSTSGWFIWFCFDTLTLMTNGHQGCWVEDSDFCSLFSWILGGDCFAPCSLVCLDSFQSNIKHRSCGKTCAPAELRA